MSYHMLVLQIKEKINSRAMYAFSASIKIQQIKCLKPYTIHWGLNLTTLLLTQKNVNYSAKTELFIITKEKFCK